MIVYRGKKSFFFPESASIPPKTANCYKKVWGGTLITNRKKKKIKIFKKQPWKKLDAVKTFTHKKIKRKTPKTLKYFTFLNKTKFLARLSIFCENSNKSSFIYICWSYLKREIHKFLIFEEN